MNWFPGSNFPRTRLWEKKNSEAKGSRIDQSLFANGTTTVGRKRELEIGINIIKEEMGKME